MRLRWSPNSGLHPRKVYLISQFWNSSSTHLGRRDGNPSRNECPSMNDQGPMRNHGRRRCCSAYSSLGMFTASNDVFLVSVLHHYFQMHFSMMPIFHALSLMLPYLLSLLYLLIDRVYFGDSKALCRSVCRSSLSLNTVPSQLYFAF